MSHRRWIVLLLIFIAMVLLVGFWSLSLGQAAALLSGDSKPTPPPDETITSIEQAINSGMDARVEYQPVFAITESQITNIRVSGEEDWATAWLEVMDPKTGESIPTEPGLVLLKNVDGSWIPIFPGDEAWLKWVNECPN